MATYYFYTNVTSQTTAFNTPGNYYTDLNHTIAANTIPSSTDDVWIISNITDITNTDVLDIVTFNNLYVSGTTLNIAGTGSIINVLGNAVFLLSSTNSFFISAGTLNTNFYFYNNSVNYGYLSGGIVYFNDMSYNGSGGVYTTAVYNSVNLKSVNGTALML
jgi:hypothetical protein